MTFYTISIQIDDIFFDSQKFVERCLFFTFFCFGHCFIEIIISSFFQRGRNPTSVPGLDPSDEATGNLNDIDQAGSFHEFLQELHTNFGPIASFWYKTKYVVSVSTPSGFKAVQKLFDRPAILFELVEPLIGFKAIQFANGTDGMQRHKRAVDILGKTCTIF